jgi:membrane-bound serine protease (ClpP class)
MVGVDGLRRWLRVTMAAALALWLAPATAGAAAPSVFEMRIDGVINVFTADYIVGGIQQAESQNADAVLITMDTPGGIDTSMRRIIQAISNTRLPVILYVSPQGARAASAGLYICQSADVIAMAPGTNIGSAHPVFLSTGTGQDQQSSVEDQKVLNDSIAYIRSLATTHNRNADWAADAVRNSANITADEAVKLNVVDLVSPDRDSLLRSLDGREVTKGTRSFALRTGGATVQQHDMSFGAGLLHALADPQVAYLLMLLAILAIGVEITHPGAVLPGVTGAIAIVLALVSFESLPVNYAGLALVAFAFVLFAVDIRSPTHGVLTTGGILSLMLGGFLLLDAGAPYLEPNPLVILLPPLIVGGLLAFVISKAVAARRLPPSTGPNHLIGAVGEARDDLTPQGGMVFVDGALWQASSPAPIPRGSKVRVTAVDGLRLRVEGS